MKYFSMFTGIGGFERGIALSETKGECIGYSEIDKYAIQTFEHHFGKEIKNYGDATRINTSELPDCIIVDIDGTLAHMDGRSPYDYTQVHTDVVDENVAQIVRKYAQRDIMFETPDTYIIIVTGRDDTCKDVTLKWLADNNIPFDEFYMRDHTLVDEKGNKLDDTIIKRNIYEEMIKPRFNVRFVLDDRDRVVKMWREQGLKVLQVAEGDF